MAKTRTLNGDRHEHFDVSAGRTPVGDRGLRVTAFARTQGTYMAG